jgi:hypothetical protein
MQWRPAIGLLRYYDLEIDSGDFYMGIGEWRMEDFKMRQPKESFVEVLDKAIAEDQDDLGPEGARAVFNMWSAFGLGKMSLTDVFVDSEDGLGTLDAFTLTDFSADGIGEISIDNLDASSMDGYFFIGRMVAGGIVFPGIDKLIAAFEAEDRGEDVDFAGLSAKLGYLEAAEVEFESDDTPMVALEKLRLDLGNYVGLVPTSIGMEIAGLDAPAELFDEDDADEMLRALGYDRLRADYGVRIDWNETDETVTIDNFRLSLSDVGVVTGKAVLGGLSRRDFDDVISLPEVIADLNLVSSSVTVEDRSIVNRWIAQQAYDLGVDQGAFRQELAGAGIADIVMDLPGSDEFREKVATALRTYVTRPGSLTVTAMPPDPVPVAGLAVLSALFPDTLPDILGLEISAVAGPEPVPFNYVPPRPQPSEPSQPGSDVRTVPFKKY